MVVKKRGTILRRLILTFIILLLICSELPAAIDRVKLADSAIPRLEKVLKENIASFWLSKSLD